MFKFSSILDYQRKSLSPVLWDHNNLLKDSVKRFIYNSLEGFFIFGNVEGYDEFIKAVCIGSSIATYYYKDDSDLDVKVVIDIDVFKKYNPSSSSYIDEEILESLIKTGRKSHWLTAMVPTTLHQLDVHFFSVEEFKNLNLIKYDSLYRVDTGKWLKKPKKLMGGYSPSIILDIAKERAKPYLDKISSDIEQLKINCIDFIILQDYLKGLDADDLKEVYKEFKKILDRLDTALDVVVSDKDLLKMVRKENFNKKELTTDLEKIMNSLNYSQGNLIFKIVQRYGYMRILKEIKEIYNNSQSTPDKVDSILEVINS